jgi:F-type H+-transporting ATPase subunit b
MFWMTAEFWVAISFVVFTALLYKRIAGAITGLLDSRSERIREEIEEAKQLFEEAQTTLASYQRRQSELLKEAEEIASFSRREAVDIRQRATGDLEAAIERRRRQAMASIEQMEASAMKELRGLAIDLAVAASQRLLVESMTPARHAKLIEQAIGELPRHMH